MAPRHTTHHQGAGRVHHVRAGAHRHQACERAVVGKTWVVFAHQYSHQGAAHHGHQRVDRHQARNLVDGLRAHHVEAKPTHGQHPGAEREKGNAGRRVRADQLAARAVLAVAACARAQQQHCGQADPAAHGMHHHTAREVMELVAGIGFEPGLNAKQLIPCNTFEQRVHKTHQGGLWRSTAGRSARVRQCRLTRWPEWPQQR